jgi:hypothetical protein
MRKTVERAEGQDLFWARLLLKEALAADSDELGATENTELTVLQSTTSLLLDLSNSISGYSRSALADQDFEKAVLSDDSVQQALGQLLVCLREVLNLFRQQDTCIPLASKFFFLKGILEFLRRQSIAAPIIKGTDRKIEYNSLMTQVFAMFHALKDYGPVQAAVAWARQLDRQGRKQEGGVAAPAEALKTAVGDEIMRRRLEEIEAAIKIVDEEIDFLHNQLKSTDYFQWRQEVSSEYTGLRIGFQKDYGAPFDWILPQNWLWWWWEKRNRRNHNKPIECRLAQASAESGKLQEERRRLLREA